VIILNVLSEGKASTGTVQSSEFSRKEGYQRGPPTVGEEHPSLRKNGESNYKLPTLMKKG